MTSLSIHKWLAMAKRPPCLDARPTQEFEAGHLPGATNIPVDDITGRMHELPPRGSELFIVGGEAAARACELLGKRNSWRLCCSLEPSTGWPPGSNEKGKGGRLWRPNPWLAAHSASLPAKGRFYDLAMGSGRNAVWLAERGLDVVGEDILPEAVGFAQDLAKRNEVIIDARVGDVRRAEALPAEHYDGIVVFNFLERDLLPAIARALRPGGVLVYETFTREQAEAVGRPSNPRWLLEPGELRSVFEGLLDVLDYREGRPETRRCVASLLARKNRTGRPAAS